MRQPQFLIKNNRITRKKMQKTNQLSSLIFSNDNREKIYNIFSKNRI